jgi:hypothetical protein
MMIVPAQATATGSRRDPDQAIGRGLKLLTPADHKRVIVAVSGGKAFGEHHRRDRWLRMNSRAGLHKTIHAPLPSVAACRLNRAVATTLSSTVKDMYSSMISVIV